MQKVEVKFVLKKEQKFSKGELICIPVEVYNPYNYMVNFNNKEFPIAFNGIFLKNTDECIVKATISHPIANITPHQTINSTVSFIVPDLNTSDYQLGICLSAGIIQPAYNSNFEKVIIK